jgi:hypothetical protein
MEKGKLTSAVWPQKTRETLGNAAEVAKRNTAVAELGSPKESCLRNINGSHDRVARSSWSTSVKWEGTNT